MEVDSLITKKAVVVEEACRQQQLVDDDVVDGTMMTSCCGYYVATVGGGASQNEGDGGVGLLSTHNINNNNNNTDCGGGSGGTKEQRPGADADAVGFLRERTDRATTATLKAASSKKKKAAVTDVAGGPELQRQQQQSPPLLSQRAKRVICEACYRPYPRACICSSLPPGGRRIHLRKSEVIVLQHPLEVKHHKATNRSLPALQLCLDESSLHLCVGRRFGPETLGPLLWDRLHCQPDLYQPVLVFPRMHAVGRGNSDGNNSCDGGTNKRKKDGCHRNVAADSAIPVWSLTELLSKLRDHGETTDCRKNCFGTHGGSGCDGVTCPTGETEAPSLGPTVPPHKIVLLLVLDATWKHAREMHVANQQHHQYPAHMWQVALEPSDLVPTTTTTTNVVVVPDGRTANEDHCGVVVAPSTNATPTTTTTAAASSSHCRRQPPHDDDPRTTAAQSTFRPRRFEIRTTPPTNKPLARSSSAGVGVVKDDGSSTSGSDATASDAAAWMSTAECIAWIVSRLEGARTARKNDAFDGGGMGDDGDGAVATTEAAPTETDEYGCKDNADSSNVNDDGGRGDDDLRLYRVLIKPLDAMVEKYKSFLSTSNKVRKT